MWWMTLLNKWTDKLN